MQSSIKTFFSKRTPTESELSDGPSKRHELNKGGEIENENIIWEDDIPTSDSEDDELVEGAISTPTKPECVAERITVHHHEKLTIKPPGPADISQGKTGKPMQPSLASFPTHQIANRLRSFKASWYANHPWLEYSAMKDAAYCFCCRHFPQPNKASETAFVSSGYRQWKKATEKDAGFSQHEKSDFHRYSMCAWKDFQEHIDRGNTIAQSLTSAHDKLVAENRHYIKEVAKVLCLTARQKIAQRGHHEGPDSMNRGNFLEIMELISEKDPITNVRLSSKSAKYTSPTIQNEIIGIMAETVLSEITDELYQSTWFSIMVDESKDISGKEQLSVVVRYLFDHNLHEEFLGFVRLHELNAMYLKNSICEMLQTCNIDAKNCVGQTYDGASVMSGTNAGVQRIFRQEAAPEATYIHCYNHRLNLVIVDVVKAVKIVDQFFGLLESIYVFMSSAVLHELFLQKQSKLFPDKQPQKLKKLSDTRWACQYAACKVMLLKLPAVLESLEEVANEHSGKRATDAAGLLNAINFSFIICLVVLENLLHRTKLLSDMLQSPTLDLAAAADLVETLHDELEEERESSSWEALWSKANDMAKELDIPVRLDRKSGRKRQQSSMLHGFETSSTLGQEESPDSKHDFCVNLYYPVLDHFLAELDSRFSQDNKNLLRSISALDPRSSKFFNAEAIEPMAVQYGVDLSDLAVELHQAKRLIQRKESEGIKITTLVQLSSFMSPYKDAFPDLCKLLTIAIVLPPTSASCERSFSSMRLIKNYLRSTMTDSRLSSLAVLGIHVSRAKSLDMDKIVSKFAKRHDNRKILLY